MVMKKNKYSCGYICAITSFLQHEMVVKWLRIYFMATEVKVQILLLTCYDCMIKFSHLI
jgi:hypothetical protein